MTKEHNPAIDLTQRRIEMEQRHARRQWLVRHCAGDQNAFPELLQWLRAPLYNYLMRCGVHTDSRDDVFQEIFLKIHSAAASYQTSRPLRPWVFSIAANTVRNHFRTEKNRRSIPLNDALECHADPAPGTERQVTASEAISWLEQAIMHLPLRYREVLVLTIIQGLPLKEAAAILKLPLNTVKTHLRRARLALLEARASRERTQEHV